MFNNETLSLLNVIFWGMAALTTLILIALYLTKSWKIVKKRYKRSPYFVLAFAALFTFGSVYKLLTGKVDTFQFWWILALAVESWREFAHLTRK